MGNARLWGGAPVGLFGGATGGVSVVATNWANLSGSLDDTAMPDKAVVWVATVCRPYVLNKTSTQAADGKIVLTTRSGTGRWISSFGVSSHRWLLQATWWIDEGVGNDEFDGTAATPGGGLVGPLETLDELNRRLHGDNGPSSDSGLTIHIESDITHPDTYATWVNLFELYPTVWSEVSIIGKRTVIATGTMTSYTPKTDAVQAILNDTLADFTALGVSTTQIMVRGTSGGINGRVAQVADFEGVTTLPVTPFVNSSGVEAIPAGTETYEIFTVPKLDATTIVDVSRANAEDPDITFQDLRFTDGHIQVAAGKGHTRSEVGNSGFFKVRFLWCLLGTWMSSNAPGLQIIGSRFTGAELLNLSGGNCMVYGGRIGGRVTIGNSCMLSVVKCRAQFDSTIHVVDGDLRIDEIGALPGNLFLDATEIKIHGRGTFSLFGDGTNNLLTGNVGALDVIVMGAGARVYYPSTKTMADVTSVTTSGNDINANGTLRTFASVPAAGLSFPDHALSLSPSIFWDTDPNDFPPL